MVRDKKKKLEVFTSFSRREYDLGLLDHECSLFECNAATAPTHPTPDGKPWAPSGSSRYTTSGLTLFKVQRNCTLKVNLRDLPASQFTFKKRFSDGAPYVSVYYNLVVENNQSGLMTFSLEAGGKGLSAVETIY